jgi:nucleoside-diphosphate-sugar epimerase
VVGDLIYVENLVHYLLKAAENASAIGDFNVTDNCPVQIVEFLLGIFDQLNIARPHREVSVRFAHYGAMLLELVYRGLALKREPPITRFGVHVFSWSKTFDVKKMIDTFGPPPVTTSEGASRFVRWIQEENPYS